MTARRRGGTGRVGRCEPWLLTALLVLAGCGGRSSRHGAREATHDGEAGSGGTSASPVENGGAGPGPGAGGSSGNETRRPTFAPGTPSEVLAAIPTEYANFGTTVALSGDTLAVGAPGPAGGYSGDAPSGTPIPLPVVFVFRWYGGEWVEEAALAPPGLPHVEPGSRFGSA
ncbi:MAG TPA: hypothetical protein VFV94_07895, partial [Polyangiaceae bacterium]|nr:hypothetical protein [Polyangiaceae bacterium]